MFVADNFKLSVAQSFTELAIQNNLITPCENTVETAKTITDFFKTIVNTIDDSSNNE